MEKNKDPKDRPSALSAESLMPDSGISVGCILFTGSEELASVPGSFFEALRDELAQVENVTELSLEGIDRDYFRIENVRDPFDREYRSYPHITDSVIYYKIFIPYKVQDDLGFRCNTETFEVFNVFHYNHMVTYIPYVDGGGGSWGDGTSLALVREYLKAKLQNGDIRIAIVAPSPFHADFKAVPLGQVSQISDVTSVVGYRQYEFGYDQRTGNSLRPFMEMYGEALGLYYKLQKIDAQAHLHMTQIASCVENLLSDGISFWERFHSSKGVRANIDEIHRNVLLGKSRKKSVMDILEREEASVDARYIKDLNQHFRNLKISASDRDYSDALSIASVYEARNHSFVQNSAVLIAGLFGGLLGALLTTLLASS